MSSRSYEQRNSSRRARRTSRFIIMANNANNMNQNRVPRIRLIDNSNTINRITQLITPQITATV